jgi:two-component system, LytTR family, response regulator
MQINCLIIDDEPLAVNLLQQYVEGVPYLSLAGKCYTAIEALSFLHQHKVDLLFLDINMPKLTGIELAKTLAPQQKIIFTTAYSEYAVESYELNAVDYLLKPVTFDRFIKAVNKAVEFFRVSEEEQSLVLPPRQEQHVFIKSGKSIVQLFFSQILFIEGLKDYVSFHTAEGKHVVYKRMKELELILPADFLRVHNSFIINKRHVRRIEDHQVFIGNEMIPVSEKYRESFYGAINKNLL